MRKLDLAQALATAFDHLAANRLAESKRTARELERAQPSLPGLRYLQGLLALAEGDGRKATQHLIKALAQTPDAMPPLLALARAQALQDRHAQAQLLYRRLIALSPGLAEAYDELGVSHSDRGQYETAIETLDHAAVLRPDWSRVWTRLGVAQRSLGRWDGAVFSFSQAIKADGALVRTNHWLDLGLAERARGNLNAAVKAFEEAACREPDGIEAVWLKAECLSSLGQREEALAGYLQVLAQDPGDRFGVTMSLASLGALPAPDRAPEAFIRTLFDQYADGFDRELVAGLNYRGPAILTDAIHRTFGKGPFDVFDAGCGTGLLGIALRPTSNRLDGVDLSPRMVAKARERGLYDGLFEGDLVAAMLARPQAYDLVAAADVLIYLGDLRPVFDAAEKTLRSGGGFAFTVEACEGEGYVLQDSRRFAHSPDYLWQQAAAAGLVPLLIEAVPIRDDRGHPVPGYVVVLQKE